MGEQRVSKVSDQRSMQKFVKSLLKDVEALEYMLEHKWFETGITRIGAEQEMVMVDKQYKPALIAMEALDRMKDYPWVETELAKFNLETNLNPRELKGNCLSQMHKENAGNLNKIQKVLTNMGADIVLTGILPTLRKFDLDLENLTPKKRYKALMEAINEQLIGNSYELRLFGIDELLLKHDSPLLEACNTSFQVHLQVEPDEFVKMYNIAQAIAAPIMAISSNSPIVFGRRLWHESRIALFQQSLDTRTTHDHLRERSPRVQFGKDWLKESVLEIYKEDIARFRVLISSDVEEDSLEMINKGEAPKLRALQVHNSTVYRWNRPCYGISDNGQPHLRIENRVLPSGPTVLDEIANASFWLGTMVGMSMEVDDIRKKMAFVDAHDNFGKAAQFGIDSKFTWWGDKKISCKDLILKKLLPIARKGLESRKVAKKDIDLYLGIIEARTKSHMTGSRWMLRAYSHLLTQTTRDEALSVLTACIIKNQKSNIPVHLWEMPKLEDLQSYDPSSLKVSEVMQTDLLTVQKDDIVELAAELMKWNNLRYAPVENTKGDLVGLVSVGELLKHYTKAKSTKSKTVGEVMVTNVHTIGQNENILKASEMMRKYDIGCLPVVDRNELIGLVTEKDMLNISSRVLDKVALQKKK